MVKPRVPGTSDARENINKSFPSALVTGYELLIPSLNLTDQDNRHNFAAAIHSGASVIVTFNPKDFPKEKAWKYHLEIENTDDYYVCQFDLNPEAVCTAVKRQRQRFINLPFRMELCIEELEDLGLPQAVKLLAQSLCLI